MDSSKGGHTKKPIIFNLIIAALATTFMFVPGGLSAAVYLPVILKNYGITCPAIPNGDFEAGDNGDWTTFSSNGWDVILDSNQLLVAPLSGNWSAWLGGDYDETSYVEQSVAVSVTCPYLNYWIWIDSEETSCGQDYGRVKVNGTMVDSFDLCTGTTTSDWVKRSVNLSAYSGSTVTLQFYAYCNSALNSNLFLDDVSFSSSINP
jgi:hypothetical protein